MFRRIVPLMFAPVLLAQAQDLWKGVPAGPHAVGFRFEQRIDPARTIDSARRGTPLGLAVWYPAQKSAAPAMTQLEYRLLSFSRRPDPRAFLDSEAEAMAGWRHIGIVPMTMDQARAALNAPGRAVRSAPPVAGKFPIVLVTSQAYLSTTAEILASNGYLVAAPVRFSDISNDVPNPNFIAYVETNIRDMEWALAELARDPAADTSNVAVLGHGGGGMQAVLLAMRNRAIGKVANIDTSVFSSRTNPRQLPFFHPGLLRVPYLYIVTAQTKKDSDQYAEFESMRFSRRYEVVLDNPAIRHHDLSDYGRGVSAVLGIRGEAQDAVLRHYADIHKMLVAFLAGRPLPQAPYAVRVLDAVEPAPTTANVIQTLSVATPALLAQARTRDPEAAVFTELELQRVVEAARENRPLAAQLSRFAVGIHPKSTLLHKTAAEVAGNPAAAEIYKRCAALEAPQNDWRGSAAHAVCKERAAR
jgi:hypothetical protein